MKQGGADQLGLQTKNSMEAVLGKCGAVIPRLHQNDVNLPEFDFHPQGFRQTFQGELGDTLGGLEREAHEARQGELTMTIYPPPCRRRWGKTARQTRQVPKKFVSNWR